MVERSIIGRVGLGCMLVGMCLTAAADEQDWIDYRQHIMKTMQEQTASIGMILQHKAPADNLGAHAKLLSLSADTAKHSFDSNAPGGNAKPEIWAKAADFGKRMDEMIVSADDLVKAAGGGVQAAAAKYQATLATCKGCHDIYVTPKK